MKKAAVILSFIFALALALSLTVPAIAASTDSGTTAVTGTLGGNIDVTAPSAISLTLISGDTATNSSTDGNVKCNKNWSLTASDEKASNDGYMTSATATKPALDNELQLNINGSATYYGAGTGQTITGTKTGGDGTALPLYVSQAVSWNDDPANDYTITITFTGSVNP